MARILLLIVLLILHGSLLPYDFHWRPIDRRVLVEAFHLPGFNRWELRDVFVNVLIYVPFGVAAFLECRRRWGVARSAMVALFFGSSLSLSVEVVQIFDRARDPSAVDFVTNVLGTAIGIWLGATHAGITRAVSLGSQAARAPAALALLVFWVFHQLYPLFPDFSRHRLMQRLATLPHLGWSWEQALTEAMGWIAVAVLAKAVFGKAARRSYWLLLCLVPARLFVYRGGVSTVHFVGGAIALAVALVAWQQLTPRVGAAAILFAIAVREFHPFHFEAVRHASFSWSPFAASLATEWVPALELLSHKAVEYGMGVWLLWSCGAGWTCATLLVAGLLGAGEAAQMWLPGRTPEITDPLVALLMGAVLSALQRGAGPARG